MCYLGGIWRRLEQLERIYSRFPSVDQSGRFAGVLGKPLYIEKTVYVKTHKTAINRLVDHRNRLFICSVCPQCFSWHNQRRHSDRWWITWFGQRCFYLLEKPGRNDFCLYCECYATMPMFTDAHISSLGYLCSFLSFLPKCFCINCVHCQHFVNIVIVWCTLIVELIIGHNVNCNNIDISFLCVIFQPRLRCLAHIVRRLDKPEQFIQAIIPEVSVFTKQAILTYLLCLLLSSLKG